jgi:hypothetical protein
MVSTHTKVEEKKCVLLAEHRHEQTVATYFTDWAIPQKWLEIASIERAIFRFFIASRDTIGEADPIPLNPGMFQRSVELYWISWCQNMVVQCRNKRYQVTQDTIEVLYYFLFPTYIITRVVITKTENRGPQYHTLIPILMSEWSSDFRKTNINCTGCF